MTRTQTVLAVVLVACIVLAVSLWIYHQSRERPRPSFEIVEFDCQEIPSPYGRSNYQVVFKIKNKGTGDATYVEGNIKYEKNKNKTWGLTPDDYVLNSGTTSNMVFVWFDEKPTDPSVKITVECAEGVKQDFWEFIPPD